MLGLPVQYCSCPQCGQEEFNDDKVVVCSNCEFEYSMEPVHEPIYFGDDVPVEQLRPDNWEELLDDSDE
jgi:hypothetical protein